MPRSLASRTSRWAHSRTCTIEPGAEPRSGSMTVWMESTTTVVARTSSRAATTAGSMVSASSHMRGSSALRRSARARTCCLLSSPEM